MPWVKKLNKKLYHNTETYCYYRDIFFYLIRKTQPTYATPWDRRVFWVLSENNKGEIPQKRLGELPNVPISDCGLGIMHYGLEKKQLKTDNSGRQMESCKA